ncbi:hypothetical protein LTR10_022292 [Elasticomyces elasticus]|uniref:Enoyl reductase (ER) domain-containing protein n=1 Tax=Exophiala sideris TaxID=1016849 RepID=A0ABR0J225_9EURO|nr:hypothetical protein LTR10_022292 [Elasticomyces elasticus]KAK5024056.1 hypothetical protein LTS07_008790 [Exophiala sideris]KAK5029083.1 hypothetical protein LTR13_008954 [Exophiala sideris]KAK5054768.1 hypothetical protein LTR69_008675 [Exophiala sideris]KAK5178906.1 hypothetical protein LTR44_008735 [Eurotiomycetes sp. CCFEE 6388]
MGSVEVPSRHKALIYDSPGSISTKLEEIETPKPGVNEVLINLTHSGVCHSDMGVMTNSWKWLPAPTEKGQVGGHEGVGTVAAFGPGAESSGLKIGDRVGIKWMASACGNCIPCLAGADACCTAGKISGYFTPGTFQQYALAPAHYVTPIPDALPSDAAAPMLCGGVTVYSALCKSGARPGDWVVIPGAGGGLGHLALQIGARGMGFRMIGIDMGEKEKLVKECGAEVFLDLSKYGRDDEGTKKLVEDVKAATGGVGAAAVVVCTASNAAYAQGLSFLKFRGTLVCVGVPEGDQVPIATADPASILALEKRIVGSAVGNRKDAIDTLDMAARQPYNYSQQTPGPPQPPWQAPPRKSGWADPRFQHTTPVSPYNAGSNAFGPPLPPPPPPPSSAPSQQGYPQFDTSAWGVNYNHSTAPQNYDAAPPLPPRLSSATGRVSPQPDHAPSLNYHQQQASLPQLGSYGQPQQYTTPWSDPYQSRPAFQDSSLPTPTPPPPPPPRPAAYQAEIQAQYNRLNTPPIEYSHKPPSHHYEPQPQTVWTTPAPPVTGPSYYPTAPVSHQVFGTNDAPLVSPIESNNVPWKQEGTTQTGQASADYQAYQKLHEGAAAPSQTFGFGGPSDWEHYQPGAPADLSPTSPPLPPPVASNQGQGLILMGQMHADPPGPHTPKGPVEIGVHSPVSARRPSHPHSRTHQVEWSQPQSNEGSQSARRQSDHVSIRSDSLSATGNIDCVIQAWTTPSKSDANRQTVSRPVSRSSTRVSSPEPPSSIRPLDPYADLEPEFKASLKRYAAMLRKESSAESDEEKFEVFHTFTTKELRLRSLLYGVELNKIVKEVKKAASLADIQAALPKSVVKQEQTEVVGPDKLNIAQPAASMAQPPSRQYPPDGGMVQSSQNHAGHQLEQPQTKTENAGDIVPSLSVSSSKPSVAIPMQYVSNAAANIDPNGGTEAYSPGGHPKTSRIAATPFTMGQAPMPTDSSGGNLGSIVEEEAYSPGGRPRPPVFAAAAAPPTLEVLPDFMGRPRAGVASLAEEEAYSPGGRPRPPDVTSKKPAGPSISMSPKEQSDPNLPWSAPSPSINAPMVMEDYITLQPPSPSVNAPMIVEPEMEQSLSTRPSDVQRPFVPIKFEPSRPAYTPFRYSAAGQDDNVQPLQPADQAYSSLRHALADSGRLMAQETLLGPIRPASAIGKQEHQKAFIGLIRKQSMAIRQKAPQPPSVIRTGDNALKSEPPPAMRVGTPAIVPAQDPLKQAVTALQSLLPKDFSIDSVQHPKIKELKTKIAAVPDQSGFIRETVVEWDRTNREVRKQQDAERRTRQEESEAHIDGLFNDNEIGYADIGELEAEFKLSEADRKYQENQGELESFTAQVFTRVTQRLQKEIDELTPAYNTAIDLLDRESESISRCFKLEGDRANMSEVMSCALNLFNKIEVRHHKVAEAHVERERRRKHLELTVLYTNNNKDGMKSLEKDFEVAEKAQVLHEARAKDERANKLMDSFDRATVRGLGDNQLFVDEALAKLEDVKRVIFSNEDGSFKEKLYEPEGARDTLSLAQDVVGLVMADSRQLLALSNEGETLLNDADYGVSVSEARVGNADKSTYSSLEKEKAKEDTKLVEEMNTRLASVTKSPQAAIALTREVIDRIGDDPAHQDRIKRALETAKQRNATAESPKT